MLWSYVLIIVYKKLSNSIIVLGNGKTVQLSQGAHRFPFQLALDSTLPSSYEGTFGHVRYLCKVSVGRPLFCFDIHRTVPFTVVRTLDLNEEPGALVCFFIK